MQIKILPYSKFLLVFFLLFSCKEEGNTLDSNELEILANQIMNEDEAYGKNKIRFKEAHNDTLKNSLIFDISYFFYKEGDSVRFREWNEYSYLNSLNQKNISGVAESYWDLGNFFYRENIIDSSYFHYNLAYERYLEASDKLKAGRMLLNMAVLQERVKDYIGSENTTFQALNLIQNSEESQIYEYLAYNNLGIVYNGLEDFPLAIEYHQKALRIAEDLRDPIKSARSLNNIGVVRQKMENHEKSIADFSTALSIDSLYEKNSKLFAMLTDNIGYSEFKLGNYNLASSFFHKALGIRDSINHKSGIIINKLHMGEYYLEGGDTLKALRYAREAKSLASATSNNRDLLLSYRLLSKIEPEKAPDYLNSYIHLDNSLLREERAIRNKFARIRFETDHFIRRANNLNQQKVYLIVGIILVLTLFFLTYIIQRQKSRNKKLTLEKQQKDSNERIYDLLLRSQQKYEEGSVSERKRISRDLHDAILSKFFGVRLNLEVLNNKTDRNSEEKRSSYIQDLKSIENQIRDISHKLNVDYDFSEIGFIEILNDLLLEFEETEGLKIDFFSSSEINWRDIKNNIKINFYRIIQESLQNIRKHANATNVEIMIDLRRGDLILFIKDDGHGFDVNRKEKGIGLKNVEERVKEIKGNLRIISNGNGTTLKIRISNKYI